MTISIKALEDARAKMTPPWDTSTLVAEHNAMPALLALARAAIELRDARKAYLSTGWLSNDSASARVRLDEAHQIYAEALQAVTL